MARGWTKGLVVLAVVISVMAIGLVAVGGTRLFIASRDRPSPQDDDMRFERVEIPAAGNGFPLLHRAAEKLRWTEDQDRLLRGMLAGDRTHLAARKELLTEHQDALAALDTALRLNRVQVPTWWQPGSRGPFSLIPLRRLAHLLCLRARSRWDEGDRSAALDDIFDAMHLGRLVEQSQGGSVTFLVGAMLKGEGLEQVRQLLAEERLESSLLRSLLARVASFRPEARAFREALRVDYTQLAAHITDDPRALHMSAEELRKEIEKSGPPEAPFPSHLYQKNSTKKLFADGHRRIAESAERHCSQVPSDSELGIEEQGPLQWLSPNVIGRRVASMSIAVSRDLLFSKCSIQSEFSATELLIALRLHKGAKGEHPSSLERLVPEFLPAIPLDDFDGRPLRYLPETGLVYSVGKDLVDDGGSREKDLAFPIEL